MQVSNDGGKTFTRMNESEKHVDNHAIAFKKVIQIIYWLAVMVGCMRVLTKLKTGNLWIIYH